jgi:hypothetical protein
MKNVNAWSTIPMSETWHDIHLVSSNPQFRNITTDVKEYIKLAVLYDIFDSYYKSEGKESDASRQKALKARLAKELDAVKGDMNEEDYQELKNRLEKQWFSKD